MNVYNIEITKEIGSWSYGKVYEAYDHFEDKRYAIKRTRKVESIISREYQKLNRLKGSPFIVGFKDIFYTIDTNKNIIN